MCRLFDKDVCICPSCQYELQPCFISFKVEGYNALAFYEYSPFIKNITYLYKGCFDYEMKDVFLNLFIKEIKRLYRGYKIIPAPSYKQDDENRGFNHVIEVFNQMGLDILPIIDKVAHFKQAENSAKKRKEIGKYLKFNAQPDLSKTKVLIVDDIYTTGSTIKAIVNMVEKLNPRSIKVLVLAKTKPKQ